MGRRECDKTWGGDPGVVVHYKPRLLYEMFSDITKINSLLLSKFRMHYVTAACVF